MIGIVKQWMNGFCQSALFTFLWLTFLWSIVAVIYLPASRAEPALKSQGTVSASTGKAHDAELPIWNTSNYKAWWASHKQPKNWARDARELKRHLVAFQEHHGEAKAASDPNFLGWMHHYRWLRLFPEIPSRHEYFKTEDHQRVFQVLSQEPRLPWLFLASLEEEDDDERALVLLCQLYRKATKECALFPTLAVAFALVWDQELEQAWPHPFVEANSIPFGDEEVTQRFDFFLRSFKAGKLLYDPRKLAVQDLVFAVDSPLELEELEFAQTLPLKKASDLNKLFQQVTYDKTRIPSGNAMWPEHEIYRLRSIAQKGGICADQAYLVSAVGKSRGIPSIIFLGMGRSGDHAWVGYLKDQHSWNLVARYKSQHYPIGQSYNPQTRRRLSEADLDFFLSNLHRKDAYLQARMLLYWAQQMNDDSSFARWVLQARKSLPAYPRPWEMEADWYAEHRSSFAAKERQFLQQWIGHFKSNSTMRFAGQKRLYRALVETGHRALADKLKR